MSADWLSRPAGESQCPVCFWPDQGLTACDRCGLELRAGYVVGPASPTDEAELADRIAAARLRHDLRAAIRVASQTDERDYLLLERLSQLARGGPPLPHERDRAMAEFDAEFPRVSAATGLGFALSRLVACEIDAIEFVEVSPESISAETLVVDDRCVPVRVPPGQSTPWRSAVVALAADDELRLFQLAGGIGVAGPALDPAALTREAETAAAEAVRQRLRTTAAAIRELRRGHWAADEFGEARIRRDTVLVRRTVGWPLLEAAAARARAVIRPVAEIVDRGPGTLADVVDQAGRRAPLRYGYDLALAKVNPRTGEVEPDRWPLFKPGTVIRRHSRLTESAYLAAPPSAAEQLALPVVMRRGAAAADWPAVGMATMPGSTQGTTQLTVRLVAPGRVSFQGRPDVVSEDDGSLSWPRLLAGLPDRVPAEITVDLVLLIELGGGQDEVAGRVALAADTVSRLHRTDARIAVIGYRDHYHHSYYAGAAAARDRLIVGCGLEELSGVRSVLARSGLWQAVEARDDYAAPLEDALAWIEQEDLAWRPDARHLLVVLGRRPPHPADVHDQANPKATVCPHRLAWLDILGWLRREHTMELVAIRDGTAARGAVADGPAARGAAAGDRVAEDKEHAWQEFCAEGSFARVDASSADDLLAATKLAAGASGSPLPLAVRAAGPANRRRAGGP